MRFVYFVILIIAIYLLFLWRKATKRRKQEMEEKLRREAEEIRLSLADIQNANTDFSRIMTGEKGYFSNYLLQNWKTSVEHFYIKLASLPYQIVPFNESEKATLDVFVDNYSNGEYLRSNFNKHFIDKELNEYCSYFDNIEKRKLDIQQRTAIVTDEDNNIIIAGAGSGKTTTIVGKVGYIIHRYKIPPDQILLISFTNKSAATLASRINIPGIEAKTFHKLGKDVITNTEQKQPTIFDENQFNHLVSGFFKDLLCNPNFLKKVTSYFTNFIKPEKSQDDFKNQGEYYQYLKDQNFSTYKVQEIPHNGRITYKREVVKSIEECKIANFLLFNNIDYAYESPYEKETATQKHRQYKPDFTIFSNGQKIYLEHYAINKSGNVPAFFADPDNGKTLEQATKEYTDGIKWKRELHTKYGTTLIETYSHEMFDNTLFDNLSEKLIAAGVLITPKASKEVWDIISESAKDEVDGFISLFQTFITLMKSNNYSIEDVKKRNKEERNTFLRIRNELFLEIIEPIYQKYCQYLEDRKEIDFSDMINKATQYIASGRYEKKLSYIIIDEFQDISIGRYQLIKAIKDRNPACKLFCVGDDWQSIYRFSGSDISLFKEFSNYFGCTFLAKIETTYRFHDPLISLSSDFILKNPNQTRKQLRGFNSNKFTTYRMVYSRSENQDDTEALQNVFDELIRTGKAKGKEILILGRYSFDLLRIKNQENIFQIDKSKGIINYNTRLLTGENYRISAQFMTIHKSKGLEADIVIVINCNSGKLGFPSGISDDPVLNLLLSSADQFENGEERRLFYVAMTRAKEITYFITDIFSKSKFITELEGKEQDSKIKKCPKCKTADLVKKSGVKNGRPWSFYGCTNYIYGCEYKDWVTKT